jgi:hypothetical protein
VSGSRMMGKLDTRGRKNRMIKKPNVTNFSAFVLLVENYFLMIALM